MKSKSGLMPVPDYISSEWSQYIKVYIDEKIKRNADKLVAQIEQTLSLENEKEHRLVAVLNGVNINVYNKTNETWHSDSIYLYKGKLHANYPYRKWSKLVYLSEGSALQIGDWNRKGEVRVDKWINWHLPEPNEIIANVYPEPGKVLVFPAFMNHRVEPPMNEDRWRITDFSKKVGFENIVSTNAEYLQLAKKYFGENYWEGLLKT